MTTWLRTPTRPFSRRQPQKVRPAPFVFATALPFFFDFFAMVLPLHLSFRTSARRDVPESNNH